MAQKMTPMMKSLLGKTLYRDEYRNGIVAYRVVKDTPSRITVETDTDIPRVWFISKSVPNKEWHTSLASLYRARVAAAKEALTEEKRQLRAQARDVKKAQKKLREAEAGLRQASR